MNEAKDKQGKPNWNLINLKAFEGVVGVREYGVEKYKDPNNWMKVSQEDYFSAAKRHLIEMDDKGIDSVDNESGLKHIDHLLCNLYFIRERMKSNGFSFS